MRTPGLILLAVMGFLLGETSVSAAGPVRGRVIIDSGGRVRGQIHIESGRHWLPPAPYRQQQILIPMYNAYYSSGGRWQSLSLAALARPYVRRLNLRHYDLEGVYLYAESGRGFGQVSLSVGHYQSGTQRVDAAARPRAHRHGRARRSGLAPIYLENRSRREAGPWNLNYFGHIRFSQIVLVISPRDHRGDYRDRRHPGRGRRRH